MDGQVTVINWTKLGINIDFLWRRLVSIAVMSVTSKNARIETHCHIHFENSLDERRFSRAALK
jgi:hypothetical protein